MTAPTRFLDLDGFRTEVRTGNEHLHGTPVVFLHGITLSAAFWEAHLPTAVRSYHPWAALTLPGHPPSALPPGYRLADLGPDVLVAVVGAALRHLYGNTPVVLVGYSVGGYVALALAAQQPARVQALAVLAGFATGRWHGLVGWAQDRAADDRWGTRLFRTAWGLMQRMPVLYTSTCAFLANDLRGLACANWKASAQVLRAHVRQQDPAAMQQLFASFRTADLRDRLPDVHAPTLLLAGDRDPLVLVRHAGEMAERLPQCELVVLRGAGHLLMLERAAQYQQVMNEWLARVVVGTAAVADRLAQQAA